MRRARGFLIGTALMTALAGASAQAPAFQLDPYWPRPLPNHWLFGSITGIAVDGQNHVWVVHRGAQSLNVLAAVCLGGTIPLMLKRLGLDPALASAPLLTTITDACGFFLTLGAATLFLPWLV